VSSVQVNGSKNNVSSFMLPDDISTYPISNTSTHHLGLCDIFYTSDNEALENWV